MLRLTLAQMRRSIGRLAAAGIAIVIGTAFVAVSLLAGNLISSSAYDAIAAQFAQADLVVSRPGHPLLDKDIGALRGTDGVAAAAPVVVSYEALTHGGRTIYQGVIPTPPDARLMPLTLSDGAWPTGPGQIALPPDVAERLKTQVGDTISLDTSDNEHEAAADLTVTGIVEDPRRAYTMQGGAAVMEAGALDQQMRRYEPDAAYPEAMLVLDDGAPPDAVRAALLESGPSGLQVVTPHERAAASAAELTGGQDVVFLVFVLTFAAIALLVAGLVITNTFQVLVAQRARTLALMRAVGANKRQVGSGVLLEAGLVGIVSSILGVAVGAGLGQATLAVAHRTEAAAFLPPSITLSWQVVLVPVLVGTLVTVVAALVPARIATRVAPLAALRPDAGPSLEKGSAGRLRLVLSLLATIVGFAMLAGGAAAGTVLEDARLGLLLGVTGGALSFVGVAVSAVFWIPAVASWAGRLVGISGPTARLAAANTLRNPRRTAATSTALLIGVTLVAMMSTGAASARISLTHELDQQFPFDAAIESQDLGLPVPDELVAAVAGIEGVEAVAQPLVAMVGVANRYVGDNQVQKGDVPAATPPENRYSLEVYGIDPRQADEVLNTRSFTEGLAPGTVVVPSQNATLIELADGDPLKLAGPDGAATFTVVVREGGYGPLLLVPDDLRRLDADPVASVAWISLGPDALPAVGAIRDATSETGGSLAVSGAALERESFETVIDTALGIVLGLLGVAVVIALIGVANTLSLSVLERRRESATLRAIGVTPGQLRRMLAVEGMLIAGVGAVVGITLGLVYGWAGALASLGVMGPVTLAVPWLEVLLVAVVALAAGLVASVAPGRSAARPSPVAALATE